jgi:hypothetical protein
MTDKEVEEGAVIVVTAPQKFMARCGRYLRLERLGAPDMIIEEECRLIKAAADEMTGEELAHAMRDFPSAEARYQRIVREVDEEFPPDPDFPEDDEDDEP